MKIPLGTFYIPNKLFFKELAQYIGDRSVLEVFAGNGLLASELQKLGVDVHPTSIHSDYDNYKNKPYTEVEGIDCVNAVIKYGEEKDILLVSWATADQALYLASLLWDKDKEIIFMGECYHGIIDCLPGCASDEFHELITPTHFFQQYTPKNGVDRAFACKVKNE